VNAGLGSAQLPDRSRARKDGQSTYGDDYGCLAWPSSPCVPTFQLHARQAKHTRAVLPRRLQHRMHTPTARPPTDLWHGGRLPTGSRRSWQPSARRPPDPRLLCAIWEYLVGSDRSK